MMIYQALIDGVEGEQTLTVRNHFIAAYNALRGNARELVEQRCDLTEGIFYSIRKWDSDKGEVVRDWDFEIATYAVLGENRDLCRLERMPDTS